MLDRIETRRPPRWIELGQVLLNVTDHDQEEFERGFAQVCENARQHWSDRGYPNYLVLLTGPRQRREAVAGLAYQGLSREERNRLIAGVAEEASVDEPVARVAVIGTDVTRRDYPYSVMAFLGKRDDKPE